MTSKIKPDESFLIRQAELSDVPAMAHVGAIGNGDSPLTKFLAPLMGQYPDDTYERWYQRMVFRWLNPQNLCFVACPSLSPEKVVGEIVLSRLGDDEGAKQQIASRKTIWLTSLLWYYQLKFRILNYFWPDRSADPVALKKFLSWVEIDEKKHWSTDQERKNRWHVVSCAVHLDWQRKGIGMKMMEEVLSRAQKEGVVIGLEASSEGEQLYRKCGFEMLSKFTMEDRTPMDPDKGGVMIWRPQKANVS
jgi:ribosomal protein S18 acetylase RimI-like enzyme